ncbi:ATP-grasp domain-containing protein [Roseobacteraceae bacterium S113]
MDPQARLGVAKLTHMAFQGIDLTPLRAELMQQCLLGQAPAGALMDLSVIDQLYGAPGLAMQWQEKAFETCRMYLTARETQGQKRLLVLAGPSRIGENTPVEFLLQSSAFAITTFYLGGEITREDVDLVRSHDVAFCAAPMDGVDAPAYLETARELCTQADVPLVNGPANPVSVERDMLDALFEDVPGLRVPRTRRVTRASLEAIATQAKSTGQPDGFPLLLRPLGSHAGLGLARICSRDDLRQYLGERYETVFFVSEFVDYATRADEQHRKYRLIFVGDQVFPCHMAIGAQWDLWYLNANMESSALKRAEEASFMDHFDHDFAHRHSGALKAIAQSVGLEYFGIDCAEDPQGNLVLFEVDNALIVHDMDRADVFPYKAAHMQRIFRAFEGLLLGEATRPMASAQSDATALPTPQA